MFSLSKLSPFVSLFRNPCFSLLSIYFLYLSTILYFFLYVSHSTFFYVFLIFYFISFSIRFFSPFTSYSDSLFLTISILSSHLYLIVFLYLSLSLSVSLSLFPSLHLPLYFSLHLSYYFLSPTLTHALFPIRVFHKNFVSKYPYINQTRELQQLLRCNRQCWKCATLKKVSGLWKASRGLKAVLLFWRGVKKIDGKIRQRQLLKSWLSICLFLSTFFLSFFNFLSFLLFYFYIFYFKFMTYFRFYVSFEWALCFLSSFHSCIPFSFLSLPVEGVSFLFYFNLDWVFQILSFFLSFFSTQTLTSFSPSHFLFLSLPISLSLWINRVRTEVVSVERGTF